jgi:glycosyltransferase involved in cell wall biosynthesis
VASLGCEDLVTFHGWLPRPALAPIYGRSHMLLFPTSSSEGWPKVLSEAMAYGVVPIAGNVSCIPQFLEKFDTGRYFDPDDIESFAEAIAWYASHVNEWKRQSNNGMKAASAFSYSNYVRAVTSLLSSQYVKPVPTPISSNSFAGD